MRAQDPSPKPLTAIAPGVDRRSEPWTAPGSAISPATEATLGDLRFRTLIGPAGWERLPAPVRRRFSKRLSPGDSVVYRGRVEKTELSSLGWLLVQAARLIGAPLPLPATDKASAVVTVTEDAAGGGQHWTRIYSRPGQFPQVIRSAKRFEGASGLEERVGAGLGMALSVEATDQALVFRSDSYFIALFGWRCPLPRVFMPGEIEVRHQEEGDGRFSFVLTVTHPLLGRLLHQEARFQDE